MRRFIVAAVLLSACGSAAPRVAEPPRAADTVAGAPVSAAANESTVAAPNAAQAAFPERLALTTKDGTIVTFAHDDDPIVTPGVMAPTGEVVVSADASGGRTTVEWRHLRTGEIAATALLDGDLRVTAVAQDGRLAALVGSTPTSTTVVLATPGDGEVRRWQFDAVLVP